MRSILLFVAGVLLIAASGSAQEKSPATKLPVPQGPSPNFNVASAVEKDGGVMVQVTHLELTTMVKVVEGKQVLFTAKVWKDEKPLALGQQVRAYSSAGKVLDKDAVARALGKPVPVVCFVTQQGLKEADQPDAFYLASLKEEAIVLVYDFKDAFGK